MHNSSKTKKEHKQKKVRSLTETLQTTGYTGGDTATGPVAGFDPVLISLIRRSMPQLIAYDIAGVQPMTGPTGLIFAMRTNYGSERRPARSLVTTKHSSTGLTQVSLVVAGTSYDPGASGANNDAEGTNPALLNDSPPGTYEQTADATGTTTATVEGLDDATSGSEFREMGFSIEKVTVTARARALKAEYSIELAQDLKAIHGLDAEQEQHSLY